MELTEFEEKLSAKVKELFLESVPRYYEPKAFGVGEPCEHTLKVVNNMKSIMAQTTQNPALLLAAAYLHDIGYSAPYGDDYAGNIKDQSVKIKIHSEAGAKIAREVLEELGVEPPIVERVAYLVSVHHCVYDSKPVLREDIENEELKLLLQADKV